MVTKSDCGTETDVEAEKGQASDAFKRAGVMFGIGRDLYDLGDFYADLNSNGYVEKNWKPDGWGEKPQRHVQQAKEDSAVPVPTTPQPPVQEPEPPLFDEPVVDDDEKKSQTQEKVDEITERLAKSAPDDKPLKEGTPPEDEYVMVKNLEPRRETDASYLLLPDGFTGDSTKEGDYWVAKSLIKSSEKLMSGKMNVVMKRWIAKKANYKFEEVVEAPANPIKNDDLPF